MNEGVEIKGFIYKSKDAHPLDGHVIISVEPLLPTKEQVVAAVQAANDWIVETFPNGEERYPHPAMIETAIKAAFNLESAKGVSRTLRKLGKEAFSNYMKFKGCDNINKVDK